MSSAFDIFGINSTNYYLFYFNVFSFHGYSRYARLQAARQKLFLALNCLILSARQRQALQELKEQHNYKEDDDEQKSINMIYAIQDQKAKQ